MTANKIYVDMNKRKPERPNNIIIMHSVNLIDNGIVADQSLRLPSKVYTWGKWQKYLLTYINKRRLPMHNYVEQIQDDFVIYNGLSIHKPSYFLTDQIDLALIEPKYHNSILIVIEGNMDIAIPERRLYEQLADKLIVPLLRTYHLPWNSVVTYDECVTDKFFDNLELCPDFNYRSMRYWNYTIFKQYYDKYNIYH